MIDLIGYWSVVSLVTFLFAIPIVWLAYFVSVSFMGKVYKDTWKGHKSVNNLFEIEGDGSLSIKGKEFLSEGVSVTSMCLGAVGFFLVTIHSFTRDTTIGEAMVLLASNLGELLAPGAFYVAVPVVVYLGGIYVARKIITIKAKLASISDKLKEMNVE